VPLLTWQSTDDARVHYAVLKIRTDPDMPDAASAAPATPDQKAHDAQRPFPQDPTACPARPPPPPPFRIQRNWTVLTGITDDLTE
jgi:hypothetical protein